jgi:hypothetical protein
MPQVKELKELKLLVKQRDQKITDMAGNVRHITFLPYLFLDTPARRRQAVTKNNIFILLG